MQIHLAKPGGEKEGPFSLEQINQSIKAGLFRDSDYWAWYDGLNEWLPLYRVLKDCAAAAPAVAPVPQVAAESISKNRLDSSKAAAPEPAVVAAVVEAVVESSPVTAVATTPAFQALLEKELVNSESWAKSSRAPATVYAASASAIQSEPVPAPVKPADEDPLPAEKSAPPPKPFSALRRMFIFSTGARQAIWDSPIAVGKLKEYLGEEPVTIRQTIPRDAIFNCDAASLLGLEGALSEAVWQAIAVRQPALVEQHRQGAFQVFARTFRIETGAIILLVLFYENAKA